MTKGKYIRKHIDKRKGKSYKQLYGEEKATKIRKKQKYKYTKEQLIKRTESRRKNGWNKNDKETKRKQSVALLGKKWPEERKAKHKTMAKNREASKKPTYIEKILYIELDKLNIEYEAQKTINDRFVVDAYIPSLNLIIEADGEFWHSVERVKKKDKAENAYLRKCRYSLLRLSEKTISSSVFNLEKILKNYSFEAVN